MAMNPYAPPGAHAPIPYRQGVYVPPGATTGPIPARGLRNAKLVFGIVQVVSLVLGLTLLIAGLSAGGHDGEPLAIFGGLLLAVFYVALIVAAIVNFVWLYKFWTWIPPEHRHTNLWKKYISPGQAVGFMFIPYFNIYWMFVLYLGIADAMERMRVAYPMQRGPAKGLALATLIVPLLFFPAAPFLQWAFAKHVEAMAEDVQRQLMAGYQQAMATGQPMAAPPYYG